jgi:hypothetical protein
VRQGTPGRRDLCVFLVAHQIRMSRMMQPPFGTSIGTGAPTCPSACSIALATSSRRLGVGHSPSFTSPLELVAVQVGTTRWLPGQIWVAPVAAVMSAVPKLTTTAVVPCAKGSPARAAISGVG